MARSRASFLSAFTFSCTLAALLSPEAAWASPASTVNGSPWAEVASDLVVQAGSYEEGVTARGFIPNLNIGFGYDAGYFGIKAMAFADTSQKYGPELADIPGGDFFGISAQMKEGGIFSRIGSLSMKAGRFRHYDAVDSPYSLFVNSGGIPSNILDLAWDDGTWEYESRWIELNHSSNMITPGWPVSAYSGFPERGANVKTYAVRIRDMRVGFQDAAVYTGRNFDPEYFLNPLPQYFIQYLKATGGRPWSTGQDENNIIGFFWTMNRPGEFDLTAQVLIDDFNLHFLMPETAWNPWQAGFNFAGRIHSSVGSFRIAMAGATKYTFEPSEMQGGDVLAEQSVCSYGYSYYPETRFEKDWQTPGAQLGTILLEDNMIGYKYGQNNIAARMDWSLNKPSYSVAADIEFRLAGANSPANPWHDLLNDPQDGTHWLDDAVLEKRIMTGVTASLRRGPWSFAVTVRGGVAFDAMELRKPAVAAASDIAPADSDIWIFEPVAGNTKGLFYLSAGVAYRWGIGR